MEEMIRMRLEERSWREEGPDMEIHDVEIVLSLRLASPMLSCPIP